MNSNELPFDPQAELFVWGPIPGKFFYTSMYVKTNYQYFFQKYGENWSETLYLFQDGRMVWLNNMDDLEQAGAKVFYRYLLPLEIREKIYVGWKQTVQKMIALEAEISQANLRNISSDHLADFWRDFNNLYRDFWVDGTVPELGNYGSVDILKKELAKYINDETELNNALEILTAPEGLSFYQEEEIELVKATNVEAHQQKFFWIKNSYGGTQIMPVEFFAERKKSLPHNLEDELLQKLAERKITKNAVVKKYNISSECRRIADAIAEGVHWQDERKKYIFIGLYYMDLMIAEMARRLNRDKKDFDNLWFDETSRLFNGEDLSETITRRAKSNFGWQFFHSCRELSQAEAKYFWDVYTEVGTSDKNELSGTVVSKGSGQLVRAKVRIVHDPNNAGVFENGDILVAPMTSPEYIFLMRKASAIITDTGGLTSHAAIVSRELGIPCLVNTKSATKILKDGDIVEVDVVNGIVRKV